MTATLAFELYSSARELSAAGWETLAVGGDARLHPAWARVMEQALPAVYLGLRENGRLSAVAPCIVSREDDMAFASFRSTDILLRPEEVRGPDVPGLDRAELQRAASALRAVRPIRTLTVVVPFARYADIQRLIAPSPDAFERIVAELDALAATRDAALWAILGVGEGDVVAHAERLGLRCALVSADTVLRAEWRSFEEYVAALPGTRRAVVRRERRSAAGRYTVGVERNPREIVEDLARLVQLQRARYGTEGGRPMVLCELAEEYGEDAALLGARAHGKLIAYTLLLRYRGSVQVFGYGADHTVRRREDFLWSNVAMYAPIEEVIRTGGATIRWGPTNYPAKLLRGSRLQPLWGLFRPLEPAVEAALDEYIEPFNRMQQAHYTALRQYEVPAS